MMMGKKRTAIQDVFEPDEYRSLLATAARLEDREMALETFFLLTVLGRVGLRVGEAVHMQESWFNATRQQISIPTHCPCDCGLCRHYAERADGAELDDYWRPKFQQPRNAYVYTYRDRDAIEQHFEETSYTRISYSTVNRRLKLAAELTDGVDPETTYPHALRATAATHLAWQNTLEGALDVQFGWATPQTRRKYIERTGFRAREAIDDALGRDVEPPEMILDEPPTFDELRARGALIEPESWTPQTSVETHPRSRDPEEQLFLEEFERSRGTASPATAAMVMGVMSVVTVFFGVLLQTTPV